MNAIELEVGREYVYLGQFVAVREIRGMTSSGDAEVAIENRFAELSTCYASELSPKPEPTK